MKKQLIVFVAVIAMAIMSGPASAASVTIYDNGAPDLESSVYSYSITRGPTAADSFVLSSGANTITGIYWWGAYGDEELQTWSSANDFTIRIYASSGSVPGALVYENNVGDVTGTAYLGYDVLYGYYVAIDPLELDADVTYWIEIVNDVEGSYWAWLTSSQEGSLAFWGVGDGWDTDYGELAFYLTGEQGETPPTGVPEPGTLMLLGLGLAGAAFARKRFRK